MSDEKQKVLAIPTLYIDVILGGQRLTIPVDTAKELKDALIKAILAIESAEVTDDP